MVKFEEAKDKSNIRKLADKYPTLGDLRTQKIQRSYSNVPIPKILAMLSDIISGARPGVFAITLKDEQPGILTTHIHCNVDNVEGMNFLKLELANKLKSNVEETIAAGITK